MKRSKAVPLIMLGTLTVLAGCGRADPYDDFVEMRQNNYKSVEDCRKDWGNDDRDCKQSSGGGYVGPRYMWNHSAGYPLAVNPDGSTRQLPNSYLARPGSVSTAQSATVTAHSASSFPSGSAAHSAVSRGGFGGTARGFSSGG